MRRPAISPENYPLRRRVNGLRGRTAVRRITSEGNHDAVHDLYQPTGVAVSADGTIYVSIYGNSNTITSSHPGEIVKITGLS